MKSILLTALMILAPAAVAGGRTIHCVGKTYEVHISAKGSRPYPIDSDLIVARINGDGRILKHMDMIEAPGGDDFYISYSSGDIQARLNFVSGEHSFGLYRYFTILEEMPCDLGF